MRLEIDNKKLPPRATSLPATLSSKFIETFPPPNRQSSSLETLQTRRRRRAVTPYDHKNLCNIYSQLKKRQFAKPRINIESGKGRRKGRFELGDGRIGRWKKKPFNFSLAAETKSVFVLRNRNFFFFSIFNKNIKYLLTITKSFCFYLLKSTTKFI